MGDGLPLNHAKRGAGPCMPGHDPNMRPCSTCFLPRCRTDNATKSVAINPSSFLVGQPQQCGGARGAAAAAAGGELDQEQRPPAVATA